MPEERKDASNIEALNKCSTKNATNQSAGIEKEDHRTVDNRESVESAKQELSAPNSSGISLPLSLIQGNNSRKEIKAEVGSNGSNGGGSGNNSDNSALVSIGNNSFGFNFDSEEGNFNSSPPNSVTDGKSNSDSDGDGNNNQAPPSKTNTTKQTQESLPHSAMLAAVQPHKPQQHALSAPPPSTPNNGVVPSGGIGAGSQASGSKILDSVVSSMTVPSHGAVPDASNRVNIDSIAAQSSHDAAAATAVANLQSIASAYTNSPASNDYNIGTAPKETSDVKPKQESLGENTSMGGYQSDDEGASVSGQSSGMTRPDLSSSASTFKNVPAPYNHQSGGDDASSVASETQTTSSGKKRKKMDDHKREERNAREKERSFRISKQINELRNLLSSGGVIVPKGTKSSVLTEAANYIRMLQQHQYRSEIDRHQLVQQMQIIGGGALGPQAASAIRHVAAQNGVWSLGNFGGLPPRSAMTYYQQQTTPSSYAAGGNQQNQENQVPHEAQKPQEETPAITKIEEHEYRFVFNSCSVGMAIASMGGAFIDCNTLFCQLSQYTKQEVCSMTIFNLTSRADLQHAFDLISQMISPPTEGNSSSRQCVLRGSMKQRNDLGLSITLIKGEDGIAKCFCVTLIRNPASPFDKSRPVPATADFLHQESSEVQFNPTQSEGEQKKQGTMPPPTVMMG